MDLIYADDTRQDIGVMMAYTLDMAYGSDENNFECTIDRDAHCCQKGFFLYVEGEEYGGIIDRIRVNTEKDEIIYKGRTWHGVLENKVICPEEGQDYLILNGEANEVLQEIIDQIDLSDLFVASTDDSGIQIVSYQMNRYIYGYTGIKKMLKEFGAKLHVRWSGTMVELSALPIVDYSQDEEFDTSQVDFTVEKDFLPVNHLICLGQGDLAERAVIHLFTDENGGVQPYATVDQPVEDADYILDESQKVMTGSDEVVEVLDYSSAEITTNYVLLTEQPPDWAENCEEYFYMDGDHYKNVEQVDVGYVLQMAAPYDWAVNYSNYFQRSGDTYSAVPGTTIYTALSTKPSDWAAKYEKYFTKNGNDYESVQGVTIETYVRQTKQPSDWSSNYGSYYYFYSDGVVDEYKSVGGVSYYQYKLQTRKPTDWDTQYGSYFRKATNAELKKHPTTQYYAVQKTSANKVPAWVARKYYTRYTMYKAPAWKSGVKYTRQKTVVAPTWANNTYYRADDDTAPAWAADTYYSKSDEKVAPKWVSEQYFRQAHDRYAVMIMEGLSRLEDAHQADYLGIDLEETEQTYDVGDLVGSTEQKTGISAVQEVVKKIIKIDNDDITISYEVE